MTKSGENKERSKIRTRRQRYAMILSWLIFVSVLFFLVVQWSHWFSPEGRGSYPYNSYCQNKLKQLGLAFHNYHEVYGSLPPAHFVDRDGTPTHSWRTLILPHIEQTRIYEKYRFEEPWNSPHNKDVIEFVEVLKCNWESENRLLIDFFAVVGSNTAWPNEKSTSFEDIKDGMSNTILLIQLPHSDVLWSEPVDVEFDGTRLTLRGNQIEWPSQTTRRRTDWFWQPNVPETSVLFADGSVGQIQIGQSLDRLIPSLTSANSDSFDRSLLSKPSFRSDFAEDLTLFALPFLLVCLFLTALCISFLRTDRLMVLLAVQLVGMIFAGLHESHSGSYSDADDLSISMQVSVFAIVIGFIVSEGYLVYSHHRRKNRSR